MFIGGLLNGWWNTQQTIDGVLNWQAVWYFPAIMAGAVLILFLLKFRDEVTVADKVTA
jgi:hypothetical protein